MANSRLRLNPKSLDATFARTLNNLRREIHKAWADKDYAKGDRLIRRYLAVSKQRKAKTGV